MNKHVVFILRSLGAAGLLLLSLLHSCTSGNASTEATGPVSQDPLVAFGHFPDSLFNGLYFNQPFADARKNMALNGFSCVDSSGAFRYYNPVDSTEIILPYQQRLQSLKLVLHSTAYQANQTRLLQAFALTSANEQATADFSIFSYDLSTIDFKLTVFTQPGFIRLNFELETRK